MITLITPHKIIEEARFLPISAKHRLFIWDYSIQKIAQKPFIGLRCCAGDMEYQETLLMKILLNMRGIVAIDYLFFLRSEATRIIT